MIAAVSGLPIGPLSREKNFHLRLPLTESSVTILSNNEVITHINFCNKHLIFSIKFCNPETRFRLALPTIRLKVSMK